MALPAHRICKSKTRKRRSHENLKINTPNACTNCGVPIPGHSACTKCGYYKGKKVLETKTDRSLKREAKRKKQEAKDKAKMQSLKNK
jgi:large subunit ribosomal protein L32